jgi:hypothetical protein
LEVINLFTRHCTFCSTRVKETKMPWFWGSKNSKDDKDDDDDYDSEEYSDEEYSDEENSSEEDEVDDSNTRSIQKDDDHQDNALQDQHHPDKSTEEKKDETHDTVEKSTENGLNSGASLVDTDDHSNLVEDKDHDSSSVIDEEEGEEAESSDSESESEDEEEEEEVGSSETKIQSITRVPVQVETVDEDSSSDESDANDSDSEDDGDENEEVTSFADKLSVLLLAAEHDRVDILKAILTDNEDDKQGLMNSGIPPLHVAISFGSTNTTHSLLRMGADPSIRPNVADVRKHHKAQDYKVEIQNMNRFDGVSAWELAFGNAAFEKLQQEGGGGNGKWSLFGSADNKDKGGAEKPSIIRPVNMQPPKREGIKHAFTAEALRCIGGDESDRLEQLLDSGMPPTIDMGGKDLYGWAVEMGALKCEELLRPTEAAKYGVDETTTDDTLQQRGRVFRPGDTAAPPLRNRLDELESLASALSTCLDNLAEEVSVCHGLLLMNGGASALASHVKSLKALQAQKVDQLIEAQAEWEASEMELSGLVRATGKVGQEVLDIDPATLKSRDPTDTQTTSGENDEKESQRRELSAQIVASEHKVRCRLSLVLSCFCSMRQTLTPTRFVPLSQIRKLRVSIADLSEENARDLKEVERRGLSGGIDLVRNLREETRDLEFRLSEAKSNNATCRAKIGLIHARVPPRRLPPKQAPTTEHDGTKPASSATAASPDSEMTAASPTTASPDSKITAASPTSTTVEKSISEQIATGDSQAIAVRAQGKQGFFSIDLWQVLLRIIGFNRAADRRAIEVVQQQHQQESSLAHIMTV